MSFIFNMIHYINAYVIDRLYLQQTKQSQPKQPYRGAISPRIRPNLPTSNLGRDQEMLKGEEIVP